MLSSGLTGSSLSVDGVRLVGYIDGAGGHRAGVRTFDGEEDVRTTDSCICDDHFDRVDGGQCQSPFEHFELVIPFRYITLEELRLPTYGKFHRIPKGSKVKTYDPSSASRAFPLGTSRSPKAT
jgi:hypothetical protein